jgi:hypothetical protein
MLRGGQEDLEVAGNHAEDHPTGVAVYNLEVAGAHTYFVRADGSKTEPVWVHNSCSWNESVGRWRDNETGRFATNPRGSRGSPGIQEHLAEVRDMFAEAFPDFEHVGGGVDARTGAPLKEAYYPGRSGGVKGSARADLTFRNPDTGAVFHVQTVDTFADGVTISMREDANATRLANLSGNWVFVIAKPK